MEGGSGDDNHEDGRGNGQHPGTNSPLHPPPPPAAFIGETSGLGHAPVLDEFVSRGGDAGAHDYRGGDDDEDGDYEDEEDAEDLDGDGVDDSMEYRREASDDGGDLDDDDGDAVDESGGGGADGSDEVFKIVEFLVFLFFCSFVHRYNEVVRSYFMRCIN